MWDQVLSSALGIIIGTLVVMILGVVFVPLMFKFSAKKIMKQIGELLSDDKNKGAMQKWFEEVIQAGISNALKDPKIKKIVLEILELTKEKIKKIE